MPELHSMDKTEMMIVDKPFRICIETGKKNPMAVAMRHRITVKSSLTDLKKQYELRLFISGVDLKGLSLYLKFNILSLINVKKSLVGQTKSSSLLCQFLLPAGIVLGGITALHKLYGVKVILPKDTNMCGGRVIRIAMV